jgi:hypothetical protein
MFEYIIRVLLSFCCRDTKIRSINRTELILTLEKVNFLFVKVDDNVYINKKLGILTENATGKSSYIYFDCSCNVTCTLRLKFLFFLTSFGVL